MLFIFLGILPSAILASLILLQRKRTGRPIDLFDPIMCLFGLEFIGVTVRTFFLLFDPTADAKSSQLFGVYNRFEIMPYGLFAILIGTLFWIVGYYLRPISSTAFINPKSVPPISKNARQSILLVGVMGMGLTLLYLQKIGFLTNLGQFGVSAKRFFVVDEENDIGTSYAYLRMGSEFLTIAASTGYVWLATNNRLTKLKGTVVLAVLILACIVPFAASSRSSIVYLALIFLVTRHYSVKRLQLSRLLIFVVMAFVLLGTMELMRKNSYRLQQTGATAELAYNFETAIHPFVYNAHFVDVGKTSVVVSQAAERGGFLLGQSYLALLIAPIPRVLWPEKPVVRIGRYVGTTLYQKTTDSGVPPGLFGEAYLNYGWAGLAVIPFLFGMFCSAYYRRLGRAISEGDYLKIPLFAVTFIFIMDLFYTDLVGSSMRAVRSILPFLIIMFFVMLLKKRQTPFQRLA